MFLCRCAQAQAVTAAAAPRGRPIPPRRDQGNAPWALTLALQDDESPSADGRQNVAHGGSRGKVTRGTIQAPVGATDGRLRALILCRHCRGSPACCACDPTAKAVGKRSVTGRAPVGAKDSSPQTTKRASNSTPCLLSNATTSS